VSVPGIELRGRERKRGGCVEFHGQKPYEDIS
jgi:hypothetical protein